MPQSTNKPVLAKDRHYLRQLRQKIKRAKNEEEKASLQKKHDSVLKKSHAIVQKRVDSLPDITLNQDLPVSGEAERLIKAIQENQVIIVAGETGSGKTTQLPKIAMLAGRGVTGQIGHTQPRRLAARSVSERIAQELGEPLGKTISYKVRFNETGNQNSIVKLMTDGILLAELSHDRFLSKYDTIIIDEAHERSLNIDFILGYVKQLLPKRPDLKVIITSATLDVERFSDYFTYTVRGKKHVAPVFQVEGRSYPVDVIYQPLYDDSIKISGSEDDAFDDFEDDVPTAVIKAVDTCFDIANKNKHGDQADILVFASTEREIRELAETLEKENARRRDWHTEVLMLFARQSLADQQRIFNSNTRKAVRRIIISTNVAETAVTVPNIRFVIDLGFHRISRYSYRSRVQRLPIEAISQASANQRKGRCGRVAAGTCIRLYSEQDFLNRPEFTEPEIKRTNLASVILQMANLSLGTVEDFDFIEPPDYRLVNDGRKLLSELGAFTQNKNQKAKNKNLNSYKAERLSNTGRKMATMPIDPRLARILIAGHQYNCLTEILIIVSALSVQDPRERPAEKAQQADQKHALFKQEDSDFLFYTALWATVNGDPFDTKKAKEEKLSNNARRNFAKKHFLSWLRLREWGKTHEQLSQLVSQNKLSCNSEPASFEAIHRALLSGLLSNIAQKGDWGTRHEAGKHERGEYLAGKNKKVRIFPASTLYKQKSDWVLAFEVVETTQVYLRCVAKIDPEWIVDAGADLIKYHYYEPHWSKKSGRVQAYAQLSLFGLTLVAKQKCNFEQVDIETSHEIFLRDALTTGNVGIQAPFLTHNLNKLAHVALMEDKLRRKDLLVDEEDIYQFYAKKVPEHIASRHAFEFWRKDVEKKAPKLLFFEDDDILAGDTSRLDNAQFPHNLKIGDMKLPLRYVFDPSRDDDGVTVRVPMPALPQLDAVALTWGIAGWRAELVESLLKSLPKALRKQIVPIPDTAKRLMPQLNTDSDIGLLTQICHCLNRMGVTGIQPEDFQVDKIPDFLRPRVEVINKKKKVVDASRDIFELQGKYQAEAQESPSLSKGMHTDFPEHFQFENSRHQAGVVMREFHALKPAQDQTSVTIITLTDEALAKQTHLQGCIALLKGATQDKHRQIKKLIDKTLILAFAPLGTKEQLENMLIHASCAKTVNDTFKCGFDKGFKNLPYTKADFDATLPTLTGQVLTKANDIYATIQAIYLSWQGIRQKLLMLNTEVFVDNITDIEDQLDGLQLDQFIHRYSFDVWQDYPRYLKALNERLDRLTNNLEGDLDAVAQLDIHMERLQGVAGNAEFDDYKWLVEEYRISLFAQPMKTKVPVSEKRLEKLWDKLTRSKL